MLAFKQHFLFTRKSALKVFFETMLYMLRHVLITLVESNVQQFKIKPSAS